LHTRADEHPDAPGDHAGRDDDDDQEQGGPEIHEADHAQCDTGETTEIREECALGFASPRCDHLKSTIENQVDSQDCYEDGERKRDEQTEEDGDDPTEDLSPLEQRFSSSEPGKARSASLLAPLMSKKSFFTLRQTRFFTCEQYAQDQRRMIALRKVYHAKGAHLSVLVLTLFFSLASLVSCNQSPPPQYVSLDLGIPAVALQSPVKGKLPDSTELHIGIAFKIDPRLLHQADQQRLQPGQPTPPAGLGIDNGVFAKIKAFFQGINLHLSKLRTYVSFQAKAGTLARLLQTTFVIHLYKGRTFYAPSTPPKIPTDFAHTIDSITGLDNYSRPPKHDFHLTSPLGAYLSYQRRSLAATASPSGGTKGVTSHVSQHAALDCSPDDQTLTGGDVAGAYGYNHLWQRGLRGEHMTINLVEVDGSYQDDIQNYLGCIHFQGHLSVVNIDGHPSDAQGESTLDIQMAAGLAPAASLVVYQTDGNADGDTWVQVNDELQRIIDTNESTPNAGSVVSVSLGIDESSITSDDVRAIDSSLQQLTLLEHMTVFVASGDCGAFADKTYGDLSVSFPASDPWAVAVGGTELSITSQQQRTDEVVWSSQSPNISHCKNSWGSGGGNSTLFSRSGWQNAKGVNNEYSQNDRQVPDVAGAADNVAVYFEQQWGAVAGTSVAAPIWATGQALVNEDTIAHVGIVGYGPQLFYAVEDEKAGGKAYFDVTSGDNLYYPATPGWDFATGLGTPNLANFDQAVFMTLQ
jgi:kumamolisin